jgi:hypothetical protein
LVWPVRDPDPNPASVFLWSELVVAAGTVRHPDGDADADRDSMFKRSELVVAAGTVRNRNALSVSDQGSDSLSN